MRSTVSRFAAAAVILAVAAPRAAHAQNLLTNPGFETGDLTGWTSPNGVMPPLAVPPYTHSGNYSATVLSVYSFNYPGPPNYQEFGQTLATVPGQLYDIGFYAMNGIGNDPNNGLRISFGGNTLFNQALTNTTWQLFTVQGTASSASTWFEIDGWNAPSGTYIDDAFVVQANPGAGPPPTTTPEPATFGLLGVGLLGLAARRRRRR